jgi:multidrug efflux system outer membrane protein
MSRRLIALSVAVLASGCALGPNYERPKIPAPPSWRDIPTAEAESLANTPWWEMFDDPQLQQLVKLALQENKDLKIAVERVEEARARYGFTKADLWPKVDLSGTAGRIRFSDASLTHTPTGDVTVPTGGRETAIYATSADLSWEIDFFGRIRRASEAQKALFLGTQEARRSAVLTLVADVARAYLELRDLDRRLDIARR